MRLLFVALLLAGCVKSQSIECGDLLCSSNSVCVNDACVLQTQLDACAGKADFDVCSYPGVTDGICSATVCVVAGCGNAVKEQGELCDDGNHLSGDGCSANCKSTEVCGDGAIDPVIGETCDNGAANSDARDTTCRTNCQAPRCGDHIVDPGEACDDGNNLPGDGCRADCTGRWTPMTSSTFANLNGVWATADGSVAYAVGTQGTLLRYEAATGVWTRMSPPASPAAQNQNYTSVWGTSASDVYAVSYNAIGANGRIDHFDGSTWSVSLGVGNGRRWSAVWTSPTSGPRAIGNDNSGGAAVFAVLSQGTWTVTSMIAGSVQTPMHDLFSPDGGNTMYATDTTGNLYMCTAAECSTLWPTAIANNKASVIWGTSPSMMLGYLLHAVTVSGTTVTDVPMSGTLVDDQAVGMSGADGEIIVISGDKSRIAVFDGTSWEPSPPPVGTPQGSQNGLEGVFSYGLHKAFVVGANGTILY